MMYGAYLSREGYLDQAVQELSAARELAPDDAEVMYELGVAYALAEDWDLAADALADAVRLNPENGWVRIVFGLVLLEADRADEGAGELMAGARFRPDDLDAQLAAALATAATGREDVAYEMLERARLQADEVDLALVTSVEERMDLGPESSLDLLEDAVAPDLLRMRLRERP
jgi:Flp pilus assembly protein TadD